MVSSASALIVSEDSSRASRWAQWLEQVGFITLTCQGPDLAWQCPRLEGQRCPRRELADVAVVELGPPVWTEPHGGWTARSCTKLPDDGSTVFVHQPHLEATFSEEQLHLASPATPAAFVAAVQEARRRSRSADPPPCGSP